MTLNLSSLSGGTSFTIITSTGGTKTATLTRNFPAGTYLIESMAGDTNLEIYLGASDGTQVGVAAAGAKSITASGSFLYVTTINANTDDAVIFTLKPAATLTTKTDAVWSPPTITDITPSGLPNINDTTTITGTNFATNVEVKFRKSDDSTLVTPKSTVRGSATSIIAGRPDSFAVGDAPYDVIVTNPSTNLSASSLNAITAGAVPVWVTSTTLNGATLDTAFSQTIQATDADGGSLITYAIVSGALQTGLSLNSSTGEITGTPTGSAGTTTVTISATDSGGNAVNRTFTQVINPNTLQVHFLVVAGGGGGGGQYTSGTSGTAGGGAGGLRTSFGTSGGGSSAESQLSVPRSTPITITVGSGGPQGGSGAGDGAATGSNSSISATGISTLTSLGGGGGGYRHSPISSYDGGPGGSGGGAASGPATGGAGTSGQGYKGGDVSGDRYGSYAAPGGGAGGAGSTSTGNILSGGAGLSSSITGSSITYATGGDNSTYTAGTTNRGNGGAGRLGPVNAQSGNSGGSGIVIIRSSEAATATTGSPTYTTSSGSHIYQFLNSGTITF